MGNELKILYVDMGGVTLYSCDKTAGRILGWAEKHNNVFLLVPKLIEETAKKEICDISKFPERIKIITLPFSDKKRTSGPGIIFSYFLRILFSPAVLFKRISKFDIGYSNSPVLVDIVPILWLMLFGRCKHWIAPLDNIIPTPANRLGNRFINTIVYLESRLVIVLVHHFATVIFTINPEVKKELVKLGVPSNKMHFSQCGLFIDKIICRITDKKLYDACYLGRITENKGIFDLILVWKNVVRIKPFAKLVVIGRGRDAVVEEFKKRIKDANLENNIIYFGFVEWEKKYEILCSSKLFVFLSRLNAEEAWAISLMEALACGLPAVTYNLAIYNHVYEDGLLLKNEIGDIASVTAKTLSLLDNPKERESFATKGIEFAKKFDWSVIAKKDLEIIKKIINTQ